MDIEELRNYCLAVKGASESFPFNEDVLVFKVMNKMFAYIDMSKEDLRVNLKCDSEKSYELRERYLGVCKGEHTATDLWNTVYLSKDLPDQLIKELINHSVEEVIRNISKKKQKEYKDKYEE